MLKLVIRHVFRVVAVVQLRPKEVVSDTSKETGLTSKSSNHVVWTCTASLPAASSNSTAICNPRQGLGQFEVDRFHPFVLEFHGGFVGLSVHAAHGVDLEREVVPENHAFFAGPVRGVVVVGVGQIASMNSQRNHHSRMFHGEVVCQFSRWRAVAALMRREIFEQHPLDV